jgi:4-aminobutyrate aminotransferase/(S)-3-amino-2-methylpropionate transaminase
MDILEPGSMSSTYGGNPLSCRSALAVIEIYEEEKLAERSARIGAYLMDRFKKMQKNCKYLGDVRGLGLAIGLEIVKDKKTKEPAPELTKKIVFNCYQRGLILITPIGFYGNVIRISPPLVISEDLAVKAADIIDEVLKAL